MNLFKKKLSPKIIALLLDNSKDFRIIPFGFVFIYILMLLFSEFYLGSYAMIARKFGLTAIPYFIDLKAFLCGIDSIWKGVDPYNTLCFEGMPHFNYPYVWGLFSFIPFITETNFFYIGIGMGITLFIALYFYIGRINLLGSIVYTFLLISPAVMLGVERGNSDIIIFLLLLLIPLVSKKSETLLFLIVLLTSMLKLFPIGAMVSVLNNASRGVKKLLLIYVVGILAFGAYLILMKENILKVSQATPRPYGIVSYGLGRIPSILAESQYLKNYPHSKWIIFYIFVICIIFSFILFYYNIRKRIPIPTVNMNTQGTSYLMGASIFITTCLIGYNFEYRLVFLLFTIPQILSWVGKHRTTPLILIILSVLVVWQTFFSIICIKLISLKFGIVYYACLISAPLVILLFYFHLSILLNFLHNYYKQYFRTTFLKKNSTPNENSKPYIG